MVEPRESPPISIQIDFPQILAGVRNLSDVYGSIRSEITRLKEQEGIRSIGFVAGGLANSDDPEEIKRQRRINYQLMREDVALLRTQENMPIFASSDIFHNLWDRLEETKPNLRHEIPMRMRVFFRELLANGGVTDVFMRSGWRLYRGTVDEHNTALAHPNILTIHYLDPEDRVIGA